MSDINTISAQPSIISSSGSHSNEMVQEQTSPLRQQLLNPSTSEIDFGLPIVPEEVKPKLQSRFISIEEAEDHYHTYARHGGFSVRSSSTRYNPKKLGPNGEEKERELIGKLFECSKEGVYKCRRNENEQKRKRDIKRQNCNACIRLNKDKVTGEWVVVKFVERHTHVLTTPRKSHFLHLNRKVSKVKKRLVDTFKKSNISTSKLMTHLEVVSGGYDKIGCTLVDLRNHERNERNALQDYDAQMLIDYFNSLQEQNSSFFYRYKVDENNKLTHCFWADGYAREAYEHFGDVVVFDTTYNTNKYRMIFAPIVGVNHHGDTILFGCGLLKDELTETFIWLFECWMEAMDNHHPISIITDQDGAMGAAISTALPNSFHRLCVWHIMKKVREKLGPLANKETYDPFYAAVWWSRTPEEFESRWEKVITRKELQSNTWLHSMYEIRGKWVPAYCNHSFTAGMSSSQRSESMNSMLKGYVSKRNTLLEFVVLVERALARQRETELRCDHETLDGEPILNTKWAIEKEMAKIYTRKIFRKFQKQVDQAYLSSFQMCEENNDVKVFKIGPAGDLKDKHIVTFDKNNQSVTCGCRMFEFEGIPCRHMLSYFAVHDLVQMPMEYILKRWCVDAKRGTVFEKNSTCEDNSLPLRYHELQCLSNKINEEGAISDESFCKTKHVLQELLKDITKLNQQNGSAATNKGKNKEVVSIDVNVHVPDQARTKGSGSSKRYKSTREKIVKKRRTCHACGKTRQTHDRRNCPYKNKNDVVQLEDVTASGGSEDSDDEEDPSDDDGEGEDSDQEEN